MTERYKSHLDLNIYQIYPRSFYDTNGDGIGDLQGVIAKLDYLVDLGVNAIWLCPCFKSPNVDNGYDVSDYRDIMDEFGTLDDMKQLIAEMHARDMKLILDLVPNHSSDRHKWFVESRKSKNNPYSDYYYWFDNPPNYWQCAFGGSAYEYDEGRGQYYLHSYAKEQPDLNWENPKVVREMQDIVDYWVDLGVDGFRIDVIDQISKDFAGGRNFFGPRLHEYIHALFGREKTKHLFTVGEAWCDNIEEIRRHCAEERGELVTLFQFEHINLGNLGKWIRKPGSHLRAIKNAIVKWQKLSNKEDLIHSLFTDNHDNNYLLTRYGNDSEYRYECATMFATMVYMMKGCTFIYQGQEFGMVGSHFDSIESFGDVGTMSYYKRTVGTKSDEEIMAEINFGSRDNARRPFAWNDEKYSGFSEAEPWRVPASRYKEINLAADRRSDKSVFRYYQDILKLRRESDCIRYGDFREVSVTDDNFLVYERTLEDEKYVVICNFDTETRIDVPEGELILSNTDRKSGDTSAFRPYEAAVYRISG